MRRSALQKISFKLSHSSLGLIHHFGSKFLPEACNITVASDHLAQGGVAQNHQAEMRKGSEPIPRPEDHPEALASHSPPRSAGQSSAPATLEVPEVVRQTVSHAAAADEGNKDAAPAALANMPPNPSQASKVHCFSCI